MNFASETSRTHGARRQLPLTPKVTTVLRGSVSGRVKPARRREGAKRALHITPNAVIAAGGTFNLDSTKGYAKALKTSATERPAPTPLNRQQEK